MLPLGGNFSVLAACNLQVTSSSLVKLSWTWSFGLYGFEMLLVQLTLIFQSTIPAANWEELKDSFLLGAGMVRHSLLPNLSCISGPFEGQRPAELAGWPVGYYGHDSAQAEVNKQSSAQRQLQCLYSGSRLSEPQAYLASD